CYGSLSLQAAVRYFKLIKNPVNTAIIREEFKNAQAKPVTDTHFPCHYSLFLLACAFNINLKQNYIQDGPLEVASFGCWFAAIESSELPFHRNNDGLTMLDVTEHLNPSYAFVMG
ncbi:hypothetical protein GGU11DRAFT_646097, partial [Lentinula aff. detonsa]